MTRARAIACVLFYAVALGPSSAHAFLPPAYGGVLTIPLGDAPVTLDPAAAARESELALIPLLYDTLFRLRRGQLEPHLALSKPTISRRGRRLRIPIRQNIRLHDGTVLQTRDICAALLRAARLVHGHLFSNMKRCGTIGKSTLEIELRRRAPGFLYSLAVPASSVRVRRPSGWIGSGPYRLHRRSSRGIELVAHDTYFAGRSYLDRLVFRWFSRISDEVTSFQVGASQLSFHGQAVFGGRPRHRADILRSEPGGTVFLAFGSHPSWLGDPMMRQAVGLGIDRRRLARRAPGAAGRATSDPVPQSLGGRPFASADYSRRRARALLRQAAKAHPALQGGSHQLRLLVDRSRLGDRIIAGQIVADLDQLGLTVGIEAVSAKEFRRRSRGGAFELALWTYRPQLPVKEIALAGAIALAGQPKAARRCKISRCGGFRLPGFSRGLPLLPLFHRIRRAHFDARLGGLRFGDLGQLRLDGVFWRRNAYPPVRRP